MTSTVTHEGRRTVVALTGEIDTTVGQGVQSALEDLVAAGHTHLLVDLSELDFIDSSGLSALIGANRAALAAGGELRLRSPRPATMRVLEITGLHEVIPIEHGAESS